MTSLNFFSILKIWGYMMGIGLITMLSMPSLHYMMYESPEAKTITGIFIPIRDATYSTLATIPLIILLYILISFIYNNDPVYWRTEISKLKTRVFKERVK